MLPLIVTGTVVAIALIARVGGRPEGPPGADPHPPPRPGAKYQIGDRVWLADGTSGTVTDLLFDESADSWIYAFTGITGYVRESELLDADPAPAPAPTPPVPDRPEPKYRLGDSVWLADGTHGTVTEQLFDESADSWIYAVTSITGYARESDLLPSKPFIPPRPPIGPPLPPDPRRQNNIARLFVFETEDDPIPAGGHAAIQRRYNMAADWVAVEAGKHIAYHPTITYLVLPNTSAEVRQIVLSQAAYFGTRGEGERNWKDDFRYKPGQRSPLYGKKRVADLEFSKRTYPPDGLPGRIFDMMESWALATGEPLNNPRNPDLVALEQTWMFIVRGAGGYAGGMAYYPGKREGIGWAICGDSVLSAWLADAGLEKNIAHELIFIEDAYGRQEWEAGWLKNDIHMKLKDRIGYGTPDAQTGSFIHESFHGIFNAIHVGQDDIDKLREKDPNDPRIAQWEDDPKPNIMGGSHLDWDGKHGKNTRAKIHQITYDEMEDSDYWLLFDVGQA